MGNFLKGFGAFFLLTFFILGAGGCSEEKADDKSSLGNDIISESEVAPYGTEGMPEGYLQVSFEDMMGFDAFLNMENFRPAQPPGFSAYELTEGDIDKLAKWRSPKGVPWTAWAHEKNLNFETHELFAIRGMVSTFVFSDDTLREVAAFLLQQAGIEPTPEVLNYFTSGVEMPDSLKTLPGEDPHYFLTGWYRENVSASVREIYSAIFESYAWYTSPGYEKGSLPEEIESAMERMREGVVPENLNETAQIEGWANKAAAIVKSGETPTPAGPFYASISDLEFLQMEVNFAALGFFKELLEVINALERDPATFSQHRDQFHILLKDFPGPIFHYRKTFGTDVFSELEFLEGFAGAPDEQLVDDGNLGEVPLDIYRGKIEVDLEFYKADIEAFIERWSELQSSGD